MSDVKGDRRDETRLGKGTVPKSRESVDESKEHQDSEGC